MPIQDDRIPDADTSDHRPGQQSRETPLPSAGIKVAPLWVAGVCFSAVIASALQIATQARDTGFFIPVLTLVICAVAAPIDAATRRIPNILTYTALLLGLVLNLIVGPLLDHLELGYASTWLGSPGWRESLLALGVAAAIGIPSFMLRGLGGGDVKLLGAVGVLVGLSTFLGVFLNTLVFAALIGVLNWAARGELVARLQVITGVVLTAVMTRGAIRNAYPFRKTEAPFGVALLLGLISEHFFAVHEVLLGVGW